MPAKIIIDYADCSFSGNLFGMNPDNIQASYFDHQKIDVDSG